MTVVIGASKSTTTAEALRTDALYDILRSLETPSSTLSSYIGVRYRGPRCYRGTFGD